MKHAELFCLKSIFNLCGRQSFIKISLDKILHNYGLIKASCALNTEIIAVVKSNAYGHGSVTLSKTLHEHGCKNFAVATSREGKELRDAGISGMIQVLGIATPFDIPALVKYRLTPTVSDMEFLEEWATYHNYQTAAATQREVILEMNTGLNRSGFNAIELSDYIQFCQDKAIPVHSIMTHFSNLWDADSCRRQLDLFLNKVDRYRKEGIKVHAASSGSIAHHIGTDLDFVRPGLVLYGQPCVSDQSIEVTKAAGYSPALSWIAKPSLIKNIDAGNKVGYSGKYMCKSTEVIATLPAGFGDGFARALTGRPCVTDGNGSKFTVVGTVSMDSLTIKVNKDTRKEDLFYLLKDDHNEVNSCAAWGRLLNTNTADILCRLQSRIQRIYELSGEIIV